MKTVNMHEAALGAHTDNAFYGRTHNPHRHDYTPGGSSGGSGAAVAAGLCDIALGTDTMGSVRIPAAYCGVYGLKPSHGGISEDGLAYLEPSLDCIGPLARDLDVLERAWTVLANNPGEQVPLARALVLKGQGGVAVEGTALGEVALLLLPRPGRAAGLIGFPDVGLRRGGAGAHQLHLVHAAGFDVDRLDTGAHPADHPQEVLRSTGQD